MNSEYLHFLLKIEYLLYILALMRVLIPSELVRDFIEVSSRTAR